MDQRHDSHFFQAAAAFLSASRDGIALFDREARILAWNSAMAEIRGISPEAATGRSIDDVIAFMDRARIAIVLRGDSTRFERCEIGSGSAARFSYDAEAGPLRDANGTVIGGFVHVRDVSDAVDRERRDRERLQAVLDNAPANVAIVEGPELRYTFANKAHQNFSGFGDYIGRRLAEMHPGLEGQKIYAIAEQVLRDGVPFTSQEYRIVAASRPGEAPEERFFTGSLIPWRDSEGRVQGVLSFSFDVTPHVRARQSSVQSEDRLNVALTAGRCGLWDLDLRTNEVWRGGAHDRIFGFGDAGAPHWDLNAFMGSIHPDDLASVKAVHERLLSVDPTVGSSEFEVECRIVWPDGSVHWIRDVGRVVRDENGHPIRAIGAVFDITDLKEAQRLLHEAKIEAEAANEAKSGFVRDLSHELRTPLTAIMGYVELLGREGLAPERRAGYFGGVQRNGQVLIKLIDDILDLSRAEGTRFKIEPQPVDSRGIVNDVVSLFKAEAEAKGIVVECEIDPQIPERIVTDPVRLRQILANVIGNAVKFTESGGVRVHLRVQPRESAVGNSGDKRGPATIECVVSDTGLGITPEQQKRIFRPFGQADGHIRKKYGGYGLGLAISRGLARALGGEIQLLSSIPGRGSVFVIRVRAALESARSRAASEGNTAVPASLMSGRRVLVVEDTDDVREFLKAVLEQRGLKVTALESGEKAIEQFHAVAPDLIVMDLRLEGMSGVESTREIRRRGYTGPIVALTAHAAPEERTAYFSQGFDAYLIKPITARELSAQIDRLLARRSSQGSSES